MQVELNSLLPSALIEICVCVLVGLSVGLVCVHARLLFVSPVHAAKLFNARSVSKGVILQNSHTLHVSKSEAQGAD